MDRDDETANIRRRIYSTCIAQHAHNMSGRKAVSVRWEKGNLFCYREGLLVSDNIQGSSTTNGRVVDDWELLTLGGQ